MAEFIAAPYDNLVLEELGLDSDFQFDPADLTETRILWKTAPSWLDDDLRYTFWQPEEEDLTATSVSVIPVVPAVEAVPDEAIEDFLPAERRKVFWGRRYACAAVLGVACGAASYALVYEALQAGHKSDNVTTNREVDLCLIAVQRDGTPYTATSLPAECDPVFGRVMVARSQQQVSAHGWTKALASDAKINWLDRFEQNFESEQIAMDCAMLVGSLATITLISVMPSKLSR